LTTASQVNGSRVPLQDPKLDKLLSLIKDSFRVREDHDPIYVDLGGHLDRIASDQHQAIFGRRGSGKSCLLVHYHRRARPQTTLSIYVSADEVKRLGYPDLLIRLLMTLLSGFRESRVDRLRRIVPFLRTAAQRQVAELSALLDRAERADVTEQQERAREGTVGGSAGAGSGSFTGGYRRASTHQRTSAFVEEKLDALERHLQDYKQTLRDVLEKSKYDPPPSFSMTSTEARRAPAQGERIALRVRPDEAHLFDVETGLRLGSG
jgi:hypothetical protein